MENISLGCQVCCAKFWRVGEIKQHMHSKMHKTKMEEVFQKDEFLGYGFPPIIMMSPYERHKIRQPIIGLSLLTLCFSPETKTFFYLCHVCEEKCSPEKIAGHLSSGDHFSNYFSYTDPNVLSYSWIPGMDMIEILRSEISKEIGKAKTRQLQMLDLPEDLLKKLATCSYSEVIRSLSENERLLKILEAVEPKRMIIQKYQRDSNRKHPLLGIQHIVECICVVPTERRHYLCTLCNLTCATHMVIKHVLSFDHIYCYFRAWHPSTLLSKESYSDYPAFANMVLHLVKQTEEIHGATDTDMKQVKLEPAEYTSVNFTCYKEALKELESITMGKEDSTLITVVTPGQKLEYRSVGQSGPVLPKLMKVHCQECNITVNLSQYTKHLKSVRHQQMLRRHFGETDFGYEHRVGKIPYLKTYVFLKECLSEQPAVGVSQLVTCVSSESKDEPVCVCFACADCFLDSSAKSHLSSQKHAINTLLYLNPWRLPLAWDNFGDLTDLGSAAREEEREREARLTVMKILDIPACVLQDLNPPSYRKVMRKLKQHYSLLRHDVPPSETCTKLKGKERFPLLGREFIAKFNVCVREHQSTDVAFLCMLCQRRLSGKECDAHVFSREHIKTFISRFHPGSLNPNTDVETLLDLAKQAVRHHIVLNMQEIELDRPINEPCSYKQALWILQAAKWRTGQLDPHIAPKMKLFPRGTVKETDKDPVKDFSPENSNMVEDSEKRCPMSTDYLVKTEVEAEVTIIQCAEQEVDGITPSEMESVKAVIKNAGEACQAIKGEGIEMPVLSKPSEEKTQSCEYTHTDLRTEIGLQSGNNLTNLENYPCKEEEIENPISMPQESQDPCLHGVKEEIMGSKQNQSFPEDQSLPSSKQKKEATAEEGGGRPNQESVKDKASPHKQPDKLWRYIKTTTTQREPVIGLGALLECSCDQHDPIYLCECCCMKILEKDIVSHVTGVYHHKMYLLGFEDLPRPQGVHPGMKIGHFAALCEEHYGYGEAQVVDVDEDAYHNVLKQNFKSALQMAKALQALQDRVCEPTSTLALSSAQPVDNSLIPRTQHKHNFIMDNYQVIDMDIESGSKNCEAKLPSITSSKTVGDAPGSSEDVKRTLVKETGSAHNTYSCETVLKKSEDASCLVSTRGTNTTFIHPDSRENAFKTGITSDETVRPKQEGKKGKLDTAVTSSTKSMAAIPKCTVKASSSTPESFDKTATPISKLTANISSCTTAKSGKCAASTSSAIATTFKSSTANSSKKTTTTVAPAGHTNSSSATINHIKEAVYKSTSSAIVTTTKSTAANLNTSTTTTTSSALDNRRATTTTNSGETAYKCATSASGASATTTKSIEGKPVTSALAIATAAPTNSGSKNTTSSGILVTTNNSKITYKLPTSTSSHSASTKNSTSTKIFAAPTNSSTAAKTNNRETAYNYGTSISRTGAASTKTTRANQDPRSRATPSATSTNSGTTATSSSRGTTHKPAALTPSASATTTKSTGAKPYTSGAATPSAAPANRGTTTANSRGTSVKCGNSEASSKTALENKSGMSNADVPPNNHNSSASKATLKIGLNYLIQVSCGQKKQFYCRLCSVKLRRSGHLISSMHKYKYVKKKYPEFTAKPSEIVSKLDKIVAHLAEIEKDVENPGIQKVEVSLDAYTKLGDPLLSTDKAFEKLMEMMTQKDSGVSYSTSDAGEVWTPDAAFPSPFEASSPDNENEAVSQDERHRAAGQSDTAEGWKGSDLEAEPMAVLVQQNTFGSDVESQAEVKVTSEVNTGQQNRPRASQTAEQAEQPGFSSRPEHHSAPQALPRIPMGDSIWGSSNLSIYLTVKKLDSEPIIGMEAVWECRGLKQKTFYLCECCSERLVINDICKHMISVKHRLNHMLKEYSQLMAFWQMENLEHEIKLKVLRDVAFEVSHRERTLKKDAQSTVLPQDLFEYIKAAQFSEALTFLQDLKKKQKLSVVRPPISTQQKQDQLPGEQQNRAGCTSTEMHSARAPETDKTSDEVVKVIQETEVQHLEGVIQTKVSSPPNETGVCSESYSVVAKVPEADICSSPQETGSNQSEPRPPICQPITGLQVKQTELRRESPSFSNDSPKVSPTVPVSSGDKRLLTRKRPAVVSVETHTRSCTGNPPLEGPLPPKRMCSSLQPRNKSTSKSTSVPPAAISTLLPAEHKNIEPASEECMTEITFADLIALVMEKRTEKKMSPCMVAQPNAETSTSCANNPFVGVKIKLEPEFEQTTSTMPAKKKRLDSKVQLDDATDGTILPSATTANPSDQQKQGRHAHSICGIMNPFKACPNCEDTSHNPESRVTTEPVSSEVSQLPINAIITLRPESCKLQLIGNSNTQGHTEVSNQAAHSLPSVETASHSDTQAASAGYGQTSQMAYIPNAHSYYLASGAVGGSTTPVNPFTYPPSVYQGGGYTTRGVYQSLGWMEQQQHFIRQQQLMQQQLQHQYLYPSCISAAAAGTVTNETAYQGPSHQSSQQLANYYQYEQIQHPNNPQQWQHEEKKQF
ncbi:uncharacterized protein LOC117827761 isoform X2 [Notolabrus celidotus]|uniref:uncharacterized protein LOC117827761 isoform X2 n=1 Tax=Notolabrus celidotus TaxID=1203425 RepID=UPI00148F9B98|nr:uncharacterized protein LOC117827761 isoform X2 [Notolabrus celidotus]